MSRASLRRSHRDEQYSGDKGKDSDKESETEGVGWRRESGVGRADFGGAEEVGLAALRGEVAARPWRESHAGGGLCDDDKGQETAKVCGSTGAGHAAIGRGVGVGGAAGHGRHDGGRGGTVSSGDRIVGESRAASAVAVGGMRRLSEKVSPISGDTPRL